MDQTQLIALLKKFNEFYGAYIFPYVRADYQGEPLMLFSPQHFAALGTIVLFILMIFFSRKKFTEKNQRIVFSGEGEGMGKSCIFITLHKDFTDYTKFIREFRSWCKGLNNESESFLIPTKDSLQIFDLSRAVRDLLKEDN